LVLIPQIGFALTTDYNTINKEFSRLSDKGFRYLGGIEFRYVLDHYIFSLEYFSSSSVFNSVSDNPDSEIDNEIEDRFITIGIGRLF
jgi:hypothetical protein